MLLKFYKIIAACAQNFIQIALFWDRKEGSSLLCSALKRDDLFLRAALWMRAFCFAFHALAGSALPRIMFLKAMLIAACFAGCIKGHGSLRGRRSVELVRLEKAMRSVGLAGSDRPMQPKIDKPIKFYARASKTARREILNIGLRGPDNLKLRIFRNAADSCATRRASLMRHGLRY